MSKHPGGRAHQGFKGLSRMRADLAAKSLILANMLRDAESSRDPGAHRFIEQVDRRRREARERWSPALEDAWWNTASTLDVMRAFTAASELADCDPAAASAAAVISDRLGLESNGDI